MCCECGIIQLKVFSVALYFWSSVARVQPGNARTVTQNMEK